MIRHIVLFNVMEGEDKDQVAAIAASVLEPLCGKIEGLLHAEVERCFNGVDFALYTELEDKEALSYYADHPLHTEAKSHFFHLLSSRTVADYEI